MQDFWLHKSYTDLPKPHTGDNCVMIQIPDVCPQCSNQILISLSYPGNKTSDSSLDKFCHHTSTYPDIWRMRIIDVAAIRPVGTKVMSGGMRCNKCGDFNQWAESNQKDGTFKCYGCRT